MDIARREVTLDFDVFENTLLWILGFWAIAHGLSSIEARKRRRVAEPSRRIIPGPTKVSEVMIQSAHRIKDSAPLNGRS
jgi:hypothetical protein